MTFEEIAAKIENVRMTGPGKATGRCPAHPDHHPSLTLLAAEDRTLVHCFAGCPVESICGALGIELHDLFFETIPFKKTFRTDHLTRTGPRVLLYQKTTMLRDYANQLLTIADGFYWHAQAVLEEAKGLHINEWTDADMEAAWDVVAGAQQKMRLVHALEDLAFDLRSAALILEKNAYAS